MPPPQKSFNFYFKIVHSNAFSYTDSKVLFAIKCREMYVTTVFLATDGDTDMKSEVLSNLVNRHPVSQ